MTRLPHRSRDDLPEEYRHIFDQLTTERGFVPNLYAAMASSPRFTDAFLQMVAAMREETALPSRLKELAVLRVAQLTGATTMWVSHLPLARTAAVSDEALLALAVWRRHAAFAEDERAVLAYTEAATQHVQVDATTWDGVRAHFDDEQLGELVFVVAFYNMVARISEPLELDLDERYLRDPER